MPKPTFTKLSKVKQDLLISVAKIEFSRVPLHEASIANIIKDAGIPRGSFYQYFEDKEDLFFFILEEESKRIYEQFFSIIKMNNGDLFESFLDWFKTILIKFEEKESRKFFQNAFLNLNYKMEKILTKNFHDEAKSELFELNGYLNEENLKIESDEELFHVIKIILVVMVQNFVEYFAREITIHEAMLNFTLDINLLKKGFCKETN